MPRNMPLVLAASSSGLRSKAVKNGPSPARTGAGSYQEIGDHLVVAGILGKLSAQASFCKPAWPSRAVDRAAAGHRRFETTPGGGQIHRRGGANRASGRSPGHIYSGSVSARKTRTSATAGTGTRQIEADAAEKFCVAGERCGLDPFAAPMRRPATRRSGPSCAGRCRRPNGEAYP